MEPLVFSSRGAWFDGHYSIMKFELLQLGLARTMSIWLKPHSDGVIFSSNLNHEPNSTPTNSGDIDWTAELNSKNYTTDRWEEYRITNDSGSHQVSYYYGVNQGAFELGHSTGFVFLTDADVAETIDYF